MGSHLHRRALFGIIVAFIISTASGYSSSTSRFVGQWSEENSRTSVEFFEDNTFMMKTGNGNVSGKWVVLKDGRIKLEVSSLMGPQMILGKLEGRKLVLDENGKKTTWHRGKLVGAIMSEEVKLNLGGIFVAAISYYMDRETFEVASITNLSFHPQGKARYSIWYAVNGKPTMIPGQSFYPGPCDVTSPPTSVKVVATSKKFVAVAKGNLDDDAICDEWSVNDKKEFKHTLNDAAR